MLLFGFKHRMQPVGRRVYHMTRVWRVHADPSVDHVWIVICLMIHIVKLVTSFVKQDVIQMLEHLFADDLGRGDEHVIIDRVEQIDHVSHERFNLIISQPGAESMGRRSVASLNVDTGVS